MNDEQGFRLRQPTSGGPAMAGQANVKIQMSKEIQNPNDKLFSDIVSYLFNTPSACGGVSASSLSLG